MQIKLDQLEAAQTYFAMTQTVLPRPVAWVLTENEDGGFNLAPFSYFTAVCSSPPLLMISIGRQPDGSDKDTLRNIKARGELVIHIASCDQLDELNASAASLAPGVSEVEASGLALSKVDDFHLPRLTDTKIAFFCDSHKIQTIGDNDQTLVFAEIKEIYVDDDCTEILDNGRLKILADKIKPISRLGASEYASFGEIKQLGRRA